jgi:Secretion system C-terminal sorting domain
VELCIPDDCYVLDLNLDYSLDAPVLLTVEVNGALTMSEEINLTSEGTTLEIGINEDCGVGLNELNSLNVGVYPNPANGNITLTSAKVLENAQVIVFDIQGQMVHTFNMNGTSAQISVENLAVGLYNIVVVDGGSKSSSRLEIIK